MVEKLSSTPRPPETTTDAALSTGRPDFSLHDTPADVATGRDVESALESITWQDGELAVVGSSRLAVPGRLFLGGTSHDYSPPFKKN